MPGVRNLLVRFRFRADLPEPAPGDHVTAPVHAADPVRCDEITPPAPKPPEPSPRPAAEPTSMLPLVGGRTSRLAALTPVLGRQKAGQALWAPERLSPAERKTATRILKELDQ